MVNLTVSLWKRALPHAHPNNVANDRHWRRRQVLKMSAHFYGRARNCFSIAVRRVQRALQYVTVGRQMKKIFFKTMWEQRIDAGCQELGNIPQGSPVMLESLARSQIYLNRQSLSNLAVFEPRTFKALNAIAAEKARMENVHPELGPAPSIIKGKMPE